MTNRRTPVKLTIGIDRREGETEGFFPKLLPMVGVIHFTSRRVTFTVRLTSSIIISSTFGDHADGIP